MTKDVGVRVIQIDRPSLRQAHTDDLERDEQSHFDQRSYTSHLLTFLSNLKLSIVKEWTLQRRRHSIGERQKEGLTFEFPDNVIISAKYNLFNFLPRVLMTQLQQPSNIYFLSIAILQSIREVSNTRGVPTILLPLLIVFICSAIKEALEDRERHRADTIANSQQVLMLTVHGWEWTNWGDIHVGDIVKVENGDTIPADLFMLHAETHEEEESLTPLAFIETKSLDGETNLKIRSALGVVSSMTKTADDLQFLRATIECEAPNNRINSFEGTISVYLDKARAQLLGLLQPTKSPSLYEMISRDDETISVTFPITAKQMILRSCVLRNTKSIHGLVIFTGHETKVFCSNTEPPLKSSSVEQSLKTLIIWIVVLQQIVCFIGALLGTIWSIHYGQEHWYLHEHTWTWLYMVKLHIRYFIIMQNFVPISLNVSLEFVKYWQAYFIQQDLNMYDPVSNTPALVRSSTLNEDLGRVHHLFTDKTGTLTQNLMLFRYCMIGRRHYGGSLREEVQENERRSFVAFDPTELLMDQQRKDGQSEQIALFLRHLALCHTLLPAKSMVEMCRMTIPEYSASSPDEQALVSAAAYCNVRFVHRTPTTMTILVPLDKTIQPRVYKILHVLEFDSERKRMSILLETPDGEIELFCKGADNVILERVQNPSVNYVQQQLSVYAQHGMRTLCLAYKKVDRQVYDNWHVRYQAVVTCMDELVKRRQGLINAIDPLMNEMEQELEFIGVTAVQDKLQTNVPETLAILQATEHMKIWTLTGDKVETAVNIGYACNLLSNTMNIKQLQSQDSITTLQSLQEILAIYQSREKETVPRKRRRRSTRRGPIPSSGWFESIFLLFRTTSRSRYRPPTRRTSLREVYDSEDEGSLLSPAIQSPVLALVVDGTTLEYALRPRVRKLFYQVTQHCKSIICCRVSPKQKADVVDLIREYEPTSVTLAIGDGANDVGMIQSAHIGIGINGNEGTQAVNASDYAIAQFCFLQPLLLVHGRWAYRRVTKLMSYMLYKNITYVLTTFWFGFYGGFSGQSLILDLAAQSFNVLYTSLPLVFFAILDQDVTSTSASHYPSLYQLGQKNLLLQRHVFWPWILNGIWHSLVIFFLSAYIYEGGIECIHPINRAHNGQQDGLITFGFMVYTNLVLVVNVKLCLETFRFTWFFLNTIFLSILLWFFIGNLMALPTSGIQQAIGEMTYLEHTPSFWLGCILILFTSLVRDFGWKAFRRWKFPSIYHILQEKEMLNLPPSPPSVEPSSDWSPLAERLMPIEAPDRVPTVRVRGSCHTGPELDESTLMIEEASGKNEYHGYAFSEDENVDSDVEAAVVLSPRSLRKSLPTTRGKVFQKMLKSVRGAKNA